MPPVTIYTTMFCPFCHRAKKLLKDKGVAFTEIDVGMDAGKRAEMTARANGRHTVGVSRTAQAAAALCHDS